MNGQSYENRENLSSSYRRRKMETKKDFIHIAGHAIYLALYLLLIALSVLFYNSGDLKPLLYMGWAVLIAGISIFFWAIFSRRKRKEKEGLIQCGVYSLIRHPEFLSHMLIIFALIFISQHLLNLIVGSLLIIMLYFAIVEEEKRNKEKFIEYKDYVKKVPRINLISGIIRYLRRLKNRS